MPQYLFIFSFWGLQMLYIFNTLQKIHSLKVPHVINFNSICCVQWECEVMTFVTANFNSQMLEAAIRLSFMENAWVEGNV